MNAANTTFDGVNLTGAVVTGATFANAVWKSTTICPNGTPYGQTGANCPSA